MARAGRVFVVVVVAVVLSLFGTGRAVAEPVLDIFAGASLTQAGNVDVSGLGNFLSGEAEYKDSFLIGARGGYWWGFFGVNLDVSYFRPELDPDAATVSTIDPIIGPIGGTIDTDHHVIGIGFNAMVRGQFMKDATVPQGRLQPYLFAGPTLFISTFDLEGSISALGTTLAFDDSDTTTTLGVTAGAGMTYMFTRNIGAFLEYRFTHFKPEYELNVSGVSLRIEPTLNSHHIGAGVTFRF